MRAPKYLLTGATGFIGRRVLHRILQEEPPSAVVCLIHDADETRERAAIEELTARGVGVVVGDLTRNPVADQAAPGAPIVLHLAAVVSTDADPDELRCNWQGTDHLLTWLAGSPGSGRRRVVYASSVAAMDRSGPATGPLREGDPCTPQSDYGASKLRGEEILRRRAPTDGFDFTLLRFPAVYGPGQKSGGLFDRMAGYVARGGVLGRLQWPGICSVGFVDDVAALVVQFANREDCANELFVVASDEAPRIADLARAMAECFGVPHEPIELPGWLWSSARSLTWNRTLRRMVPRRLWQPFWRLSLMVASGFWLDAAKQRRFAAPPFRKLSEGLVATFPERAARSRERR